MHVVFILQRVEHSATCFGRLESAEHIGIPLTVEEADSKYFPISNSAKEVRDKLVRACLKKGVEFR